MEQIQYFLPIITAILGFLLSYLFRKTKTIEVVKEVIKLVEVKTKVNQVQVAEGIIQYIKGWDYFNRKQVVTKHYGLSVLSPFKNGDIFEYVGDPKEAELIFETVSYA